MSDDKMSRVDESGRDFEARGRLECESIEQPGFYFMVDWSGPLQTVDASFDHAFGTERRTGVESLSGVATEEIELRSVCVLDRDENEVRAETFLNEIRKLCLKQYQNDEYEEVEL